MGGAEFAVLADIAQGPLSRAQKTVEEFGLEQRTQLRLSDGFENVASDEFDTALICGLGGLNIIGVLCDADEKLPVGVRLVLQPQTDAVNLRAFLFFNGYGINRETAVCDKGHVYTVITCERTELRHNAPKVSDYTEFLPKWNGYRQIWLGALDPTKDNSAQYLKNLLYLTRNRRDGALLASDQAQAAGFTGLIDNIIGALTQ